MWTQPPPHWTCASSYLRPGVLRYFTLASEFAALIDAVPLQPHDEAAMCFVPVEPRAEES